MIIFFPCVISKQIQGMLLVLVVPCGLWQATKSRLESLELAVVHGDYLYAVLYQVPFRVVRKTLPDEPMGSLLTLNMHGDQDVSDAESPDISFKDFRLLALCVRILGLNGTQM